MEDLDLLKKAGLNEAQAAVYSALLKNGALTPVELAEKTGQSRENCYAVAKKLAELELVEQIDDKKIAYRLLNPSNLEVLVEKRRKVLAKNEKFVKDNISSLLDIFYANNEMPGARTLEGVEGIKEVYRDTLRVKKDIYFLRTVADIPFWNDDEELSDFLSQYREQRAIMGIHTYALTPVTSRSIKNMRSGKDSAWNFQRVWMPEGDYTAPAEIMVYGDKVAISTYDKMQISTIITSPIIAESMRQILKIMMNFYQNYFKQEQ
ncbi:winged helix-turn-helix transcriptional regulator [Candidatus Saccharibacteria bacterium]|nr:winged helix-turn-helix transcriptional regulator [Candidatus Saccharibacteria bacterium]